MEIEDIWNQQPISIDFSDFTQPARRMPPIETDEVSLEILSGEGRRSIMENLFFNGRVTALLRYKEKPGQRFSIDEFAEEGTNEVVWQVTQMQGVNGKVGFRTNSCLDIPSLWAAVVESVLPQAKERGVKRIVIKDPNSTVSADAESEQVIGRYQALAQKLGMEYTEKLQFFIREL